MSQKSRYTLWGAVFGFMFPVLATAIEMIRLEVPFSFGEIIQLHSKTALLLIIDTAPLFLGAFSYWVGYTADKLVESQQKQKEIVQKHNDELEKSNEELRELNSMLDGLVYTASHDLKTPVVNFKSMLKMLEKVRTRPNSEKMVDDILARMDRATDKFQATITDLLDISKLEKELNDPVEEIRLSEMVKEIEESLVDLPYYRNAEISVDPGDSPNVLLQKRYLHSILMNLLSNALKYSDPDRKPRIKITKSIQGKFSKITIADNGLGMDLKKTGEKLFKMFTRLHKQAEGSGIGLYIVKRTIEKCGGSISVESEVGIGTTFTILLPENANLWENSVA